MTKKKVVLAVSAPKLHKLPPVASSATTMDAKCATAIAKLIKWTQGQADLARVAHVSPVAVTRWKNSGRVGRTSALVLSQIPGCPLSFAQIRPDIKAFVPTAAQEKAIKLAIKAGLAYLKKRGV